MSVDGRNRPTATLQPPPGLRTISPQANRGQDGRPLEIAATVTNWPGHPQAVVRTDDAEHELSIAPKSTGGGSATNGGEFLMLALATCYCNGLYREAARLGLWLEGVQVEAVAEFAG